MSEKVKLFRIDDGERTWIIARSEGEALGLATADYGSPKYLEDMEPEITEETAGEPISVKDEDGVETTRFAADWAADPGEVPRVLCSTAW